MSDQPLPQDTTEKEPIVAPSTSDPVETPEDINWKNFRDQRKKEREEKELAQKKLQEKEAEIAALKAAMEAAFAKNAPAPQYQEQNYFNEIEVTEEQRIEKKIAAMLAIKEEQMRREAEERERKEYPAKLAKDYPDLSQVCSQENLDYLDYHYPEISRTFQRLPDGYDKWADIYKSVKKLVPNVNAKKDAAKIQDNLSKPKSISSPSVTPQSTKTSYDWQEIERRRMENWERMQRSLKSQ